MYYEQEPYDIRLEWGERGIDALGPSADAIVVVDVLSFTSCVDVALARGALVFPFRGAAADAAALAAAHDAYLAGRRGDGAAYSLSPASLQGLPAGSRIVLPSPNGSQLTLAAAAHAPVFAACLRNARAVAHYLRDRYRRIVVIPCGERWWPAAALRPALEDLLGAGAVVRHLGGSRSPEAEHAAALFAATPDVPATVTACVSGVELVEKGHGDDVALAAAVDVSAIVPCFRDDRYVPAAQ